MLKAYGTSFWIWIALIFAANLILKLLYLDARDVAMDEPFSIWWAQHSLDEIGQMLKTENNPPLHFLLLHFWIKVFGISAFAVRLPSAIFSSLTAVMVFWLCLRHFDFRAALFATLFFTLSTLQMSFAHEARVYALFELLTVCNLLLTLKIVEQPDRKDLFPWLLLCDILLVYAHYFGWIAVALQMLWFFMHPVRKTIQRRVLLVLILLLAAYSPNFLTMVLRFKASTGGTWVPAPDWTELYGNINRFLNSRYVTLVAGIMILAGVGNALLQQKAKTLISHFRKSPTLLYLMAWFVLAWGAMFVVSLKLPVFLDRYLLFLTPVIYIIIAGIFHALKLPSWLNILLNTCIAVCMLIFFQPNPDNHRRVAELASKIRHMQTAKSVVLISPQYTQLEFAYHYDRAIFKQYDSTTCRLQQAGIFPVSALKEVPADILDSAERIIYLDCGTRFALGQDAIEEALNGKYTRSDSCSVYSIYKITTFTK